jgi:hypothetical protein
MLRLSCRKFYCWDWGVTQMVKCMLSKCKVLCSNPNITKKKKKEKISCTSAEYQQTTVNLYFTRKNIEQNQEEKRFKEKLI